MNAKMEMNYTKRKVPGTSTRNRVTAATGLHLPGLPQVYWDTAELRAPSPAKQGLSNTERQLVA